MITGGKVFLKAIEICQTANYHAWINDPETNFTRGLYHPISMDESQNWITSLGQKQDELHLAIYNSDHVHIGFICLRKICSRSRRAEISIYIGDKNHWSKGNGADAIHSLSQYAFEQMNLHRIWLECNPEYVAVVKCYEKVGFIVEGRLRESYYRHGKYKDTCIMGLLRQDLKRP